MSRTEAMRVMQQPTWGDMSYAMAAELIAAKINVADGNNTPCVQEILHQADEWMHDNAVGSGVDADSAEWRSEGREIFAKLHDYNRAVPCPALVE